MEGSPHKNHEDHIEGKGMNSLNRYILVHLFIPMLQAMKIPDAKAAHAISSQETYGILLLPSHSNRIDCCLSLSCV